MSWLGDAFGDTGSGSSCSGGDGLGDIVGFEGDCKEGELNCQLLASFYVSVGSPPQFAAAVKAIGDSLAAAENSLSRNVPFTPVCNQIKAIGKQAADLLPQIAAAAGVAAPPPVKVPTGTLGQLLTLAEVLVGGVVVVGALTGAKIMMQKHGGRR